MGCGSEYSNCFLSRAVCVNAASVAFCDHSTDSMAAFACLAVSSAALLAHQTATAANIIPMVVESAANYAANIAEEEASAAFMAAPSLVLPWLDNTPSSQPRKKLA